MTNETPDVVQIPAEKYEINLTIEDNLTPLSVFARQTHVAQALASSPDAQQQAAELAALATRALDAAGRLNVVALHLLSPIRPESKDD